MKEVKILEQHARQLQPDVDFQDMQTLAALETDPKVPFFLHRDEELDEPKVNPDGSVGYVRTVNLNGIQWQIPVEKRVEIPASIYEIIAKSEEIKARYKPRPQNFQRVNLGYDHLFNL